MRWMCSVDTNEDDIRKFAAVDAGGSEGVTALARPCGYRLLFAALLTKLSASPRCVSISAHVA